MKTKMRKKFLTAAAAAACLPMNISAGDTRRILSRFIASFHMQWLMFNIQFLWLLCVRNEEKFAQSIR
jgi:hypothetical protein